MIVSDVMWCCSLNLNTVWRAYPPHPHTKWNRLVPSDQPGQCRKQNNSVTTWTHVELQALGPLSDHAVARPAHVVPLVLKQVIASRGVAVTVERYWSTGTSCGGQKHTWSMSRSIMGNRLDLYGALIQTASHKQWWQRGATQGGVCPSSSRPGLVQIWTKHPIIFRRNWLNISVSCKSVSSSLHTHTWCLNHMMDGWIINNYISCSILNLITSPCCMSCAAQRGLKPSSCCAAQCFIEQIHFVDSLIYSVCFCFLFSLGNLNLKRLPA